MNGGGRNIIQIDIASNLPSVMADRQRIVQILSNLLSNASGNSPESSPIRIAAVLEGSHVAVSVADGGREYLPNVCRTCSGSSLESKTKKEGVTLRGLVWVKRSAGE